MGCNASTTSTKKPKTKEQARKESRLAQKTKNSSNKNTVGKGVIDRHDNFTTASKPYTDKIDKTSGAKSNLKDAKTNKISANHPKGMLNLYFFISWNALITKVIRLFILVSNTNEKKGSPESFSSVHDTDSYVDHENSLDEDSEDEAEGQYFDKFVLNSSNFWIFDTINLFRWRIPKQ